MSSSLGAARRALWPRLRRAAADAASRCWSARSGRAKRSSSPAVAAATSPTCTRGPIIFSRPIPTLRKSALARYTPADFIRLVERHGIAYHEKTLGQLFCDGSAQQIVDLLMSECAAGRRARDSVDGGERSAPRRFFRRRSRSSPGNDVFTAPALVVATGGLSIPKMGATGFGYEIARQFRIPIEPCRPALVPLTLSGAEHAAFRRPGRSFGARGCAHAASRAFAKKCCSRIAG